jgi:hypothetical protein
MTERKPLPRTIRGARPTFFADPAIDKVLAISLQLSSEVWALRERLAAVEAIARARGVVLDGEVDRHEFAPDDAARLDSMRKEFIEGLFRVLQLPTSGSPVTSIATPAEPAAAAKRERRKPARKSPRTARRKAAVRRR